MTLATSLVPLCLCRAWGVKLDCPHRYHDCSHTRGRGMWEWQLCTGIVCRCGVLNQPVAILFVEVAVFDAVVFHLCPSSRADRRCGECSAERRPVWRMCRVEIFDPLTNFPSRGVRLYSSVGRASDCLFSQPSDGPWFDFVLGQLSYSEADLWDHKPV